MREERRTRNLVDSLVLFLHYPELTRTCSDCQQWVYEGDDGKRMGSRIAVVHGSQVPRRPGVPTPCGYCPRAKPDGMPHPEKELSTRSWKAYRCYLEIQAGAPMPNDAIVRQNCALIRQIEDQHQRLTTGLLTNLMSLRAR